MPIVRVNASAVISAPPVVVYDLIADYHKGHPSILPPQYFQNVVPPYLRKVYAAELQLLAERAVAAATHSQ